MSAPHLSRELKDPGLEVKSSLGCSRTPGFSAQESRARGVRLPWTKLSAKRKPLPTCAQGPGPPQVLQSWGPWCLLSLSQHGLARTESVS